MMMRSLKSFSALSRIGWTTDSSTPSVSAYDTYDTYDTGISAVIDGDRGTMWTSGRNSDWIQVDMSANRDVYRVHIDFEDL